MQEGAPADRGIEGGIGELTGERVAANVGDPIGQAAALGEVGRDPVQRLQKLA